jgi:hypothetical protein
MLFGLVSALLSMLKQAIYLGSFCSVCVNAFLNPALNSSGDIHPRQNVARPLQNRHLGLVAAPVPARAPAPSTSPGSGAGPAPFAAGFDSVPVSVPAPGDRAPAPASLLSLNFLVALSQKGLCSFQSIL